MTSLCYELWNTGEASNQGEWNHRYFYFGIRFSRNFKIGLLSHAFPNTLNLM